MKYLMQITMAVSIAALSYGNAVAEETEIKSPDIRSKLDMMVKDKMNRLIRKTYEYSDGVHIAEQVDKYIYLIPVSSAKKTGYILKESGS